MLTTVLCLPLESGMCSVCQLVLLSCPGLVLPGRVAKFFCTPQQSSSQNSLVAKGTRLVGTTGFYHSVQQGPAIPENRENKKGKFSLFCHRHALLTTFDIFVVTYRVTNFLPKAHQHAIIFYGKNWISGFFFNSPIFRFCCKDQTRKSFGLPSPSPKDAPPLHWPSSI